MSRSKAPGGADGVDFGFAPPCGFITRSVHLAMMAAAQRDDEFVAHLAPERTMLREPQVVREGGLESQHGECGPYSLFDAATGVSLILDCPSTMPALPKADLREDAA